MEQEFQDYEQNEKWRKIFRNVTSMSVKTLSTKDARRPENRSLNRYMDVVPYDKTRVKLERYNLDYINASHVCVPAADRKYILTQGPLPNTAGHFWLMVWEQKSRAILMLNNLIECGQIKCYKYWPDGMAEDDVDEIKFNDVNLTVRLTATERFNSYKLRKFNLYDELSQTSREILHFHYTSWPDFDLPRSSESFLEFLAAVRRSGCLDSQRYGPTVIHCSAGIGRSGTFVLVDSSLVLIEKNKCRDSINVIDALVELRNYRAGLVQTADQLRFSFLAILDGSKHLKKETKLPKQISDPTAKIKRSFGIDEEENETEPLEPKDIMAFDESATNPKPRRRSDSGTPPPLETSNSNNKSHDRPENNRNKQVKQQEREERRQKTMDAIQRIKRKQKEVEERLKFNDKLYRYFKTVSWCVGVAICVVGIVIFYKRRNLDATTAAATTAAIINHDT